MKKIIFIKIRKTNQKMLEANFWQDKANQKIIKEKKLFEDLDKFL